MDFNYYIYILSISYLETVDFFYIDALFLSFGFAERKKGHAKKRDFLDLPCLYSLNPAGLDLCSVNLSV